MNQYINKSDLVAEIKKLRDRAYELYGVSQFGSAYNSVLDVIDTLEVIDPYERCVQYDSIKTGIQAHAETYSFNIESELFNQLTTEEQQGLWRKEIEQACVSGGEVGVELAKDPRYKENNETKEVDLTDRKTNWCPSKKQIESLHDMLRWNIGEFNYQKWMEVNSLYDNLTKILDYETDRQK